MLGLGNLRSEGEEGHPDQREDGSGCLRPHPGRGQGDREGDQRFLLFV